VSPKKRTLILAVVVVVTGLVAVWATVATSQTTRGAERIVETSLTGSSATPAYGPTRGGTLVTIAGTGFSGVTSVDFGAKSARFTVIDDTALTAVTPAGSGTVAIRVTNPGWKPATSEHGRFTYLTVPTVRTATPATGPARGGTTVLVRGSGFAPGAKVLVGSNPALVVRVRNPDALFAVMPAGFGLRTIRVVTPGGTSRATPPVRFGYRSKVLVIGDSLGIDLGWGFSNRLYSVTDDAVGSTGIVRWDYYNWPAHLRADLRAVRPTIVIALFGANDQQRIPTSKGIAAVGTRAWAKAYEARVREIASIVTSHGATLAWVGLPRMGPHAVISASFVDEVNLLDHSAMRAIQRAGFVSTAKLFTTSEGRYTPMVRLPRGVVAVGRQTDEVHLTPAGATAIDSLVLQWLSQFAKTVAH
jgi:lysophospholipase L1-like esterase